MLAAITLAPTLRPASAQAQPGDFTIGGFIGGQLGSAASSMRDLARYKAEWTGEIRSARARFWATYPSGAGLAEAEQQFAEQLWQKDLYELAVAAGNRISYGTAEGGVAGAIERITGGSVDGGITPVAKPMFTAWVNAVLESSTMSVAGNKFVTPAAIASERSEAAYRAYQRVRDFHELMRSEHSPLRSTDPQTYLAALFVREHGLGSLSEARTQVDAIETALGAANVRSAAADVRVRSTQISSVQNDPLGHIVLTATESQRASPDARLAVLLNIAAGIDWTHDWVRTNLLYQDLVSRYTAPRLHALHQRLIALPRFSCGPVRGEMTCYHNVLNQGEDAFFAAVAQQEANRASQAERQAANEARFTNPSSEFLKTEEYWVGKARRDVSPYEQVSFVYKGHWKANATAALDAKVRTAMEQLEPLIDRHIALEESQFGRPKTAEDDAAYPPLYRAMETQIAEVRQACERAGAASESCTLLAIAEAAIAEFRRRRYLFVDELVTKDRVLHQHYDRGVW